MTDASRRRTSGARKAVRLVDEVTTGPAGAMTRDGRTITGDLTVVTAALRDGRAEVSARRAGADEWHPLAGSPFPVPAEGIETLHAIVVAAIAAGAP
ncbi:hypothetical protein K7472_26210 [Streptomyces sp. PTM05]|uniref:Uncharacterized protein n=1 Tax=Streptantibioticus parmotrematis TaxID=2873249 RepID=A0ABS7QYM1_9ACTN|nr:hypothetical protein [Streptantibioticus parmotrematis]MBY8888306.1 hypothetical protein [Streptantibioticus parmotrematis]